ncbi:MAG: hypothetical protein HY079_06005 [Elusimicrobia bacterium]|nr:hypothetical protein [Elusimicrobiota bacterium]
MRTRAAPLRVAVLSLALVGAGPSHALSLRSSAAESFLGDAAPGTEVVYSKATGRRLRVENSGRDPASVEFEVVLPPPGGCKDGYEPWPHPESVRLRPTPSGAELGPDGAAEADLVVTVPESMAPDGGQYEIDVVATGRDRAGASLSLKTRALLTVGARLASGAAPPGGWADRPGFTVSPPRAGGGAATLKLIDAGDETLKVSLTPAREWDEDARIPEGYEPAPNPRWLRLTPSVVEVRAGAIGSARLEAAVPRQERYAGRKFAFVVAADAEAGGRVTRRWFVLTTDTSRWEEEHLRAR